jgi:mannose-6-phosphate isomerase-like protein (cupin superfamily)
MLEGTMEITVGDSSWRLKAGDCLAMRLDSPTVFRNPTRQRARYLVALTTSPANERRNG